MINTHIKIYEVVAISVEMVGVAQPKAEWRWCSSIGSVILKQNAKNLSWIPTNQENGMYFFLKKKGVTP